MAQGDVKILILAIFSILASASARTEASTRLLTQGGSSSSSSSSGSTTTCTTTPTYPSGCITQTCNPSGTVTVTLNTLCVKPGLSGSSISGISIRTPSGCTQYTEYTATSLSFLLNNCGDSFQIWLHDGSFKDASANPLGTMGSCLTTQTSQCNFYTYSGTAKYCGSCSDDVCTTAQVVGCTCSRRARTCSPVSFTTPSTTVCPGSTSSLSVSGGCTGTTYTVTETSSTPLTTALTTTSATFASAAGVAGTPASPCGRTATLVAADQCGNTATQSMTVGSTTSQVTITGSGSVCPSSTSSYSATSTLNCGTVTVNGADSNGVVTFGNTCGSRTITATDMCGNTGSKTVMVGATTGVTVSVTGPSSVCPGSSRTAFSATSSLTSTCSTVTASIVSPSQLIGGCGSARVYAQDTCGNIGYTDVTVADGTPRLVCSGGNCNTFTNTCGGGSVSYDTPSADGTGCSITRRYHMLDKCGVDHSGIFTYMLSGQCSA